MNERIKTLWSQAGGHYNSGNQHTWPEYTIDDPKKFAELIVRECAQQCWTVSELESKGSVVNECAKRIRKHFGIEE
jgi:hypothetical protein